MRVAMFGHKKIPSREGGIEIVVEELACHMVKCGHEVTCYNRRNKGKVSSEYCGIKIKTVPTIQKRGLAALSASFFATFQSSFGPYDVVHIHAEGPAFFSWLPRLFGKRVVVTIHGLDWQRAKWGKIASWFIHSGEKSAAKYAHEIIVLSKNMQSYFLQKYNRETHLIPNGISRPVLCDADMIHRWGLEKDSYILFVGRLVPEKGLDYLKGAWKEIITDKKLVIVGAGDDEKYVYRLRQDFNAVFTGFAQGKLLRELFSNAYFYVLPSDVEGMPISLLEAMSYGNCCLVSDIPECAEVIGKYGITFPRGDAAALQTIMQTLCDDSSYVNQYRAGTADYICKSFKWDTIVEQTLKLYKGEVY